MNSLKSVGVLFLAIFLTSVASLVARFWRSRGQERQQMKRITYATGATFAMVWLAGDLARCGCARFGLDEGHVAPQ